jgi:hypothetical protein
LGSDLDNRTIPSDSHIYFELDDLGNASVHPDNFRFWHNLAHFTITGFQPLDPLLVLQANYLTPELLAAVRSGQGANQPLTASDEIAIPGFKAVVTDWGPTSNAHTVVKRSALIETPGASNYLFERQPGPEAEEALTITKSLINQVHSYAVARGMTFRLVTVPAFPESFYQKYEGNAWQPELGPYDLFRPDRELQAFAEAEGIPFLSIGQLMYENRLPSDEIRSFYYSDGTGHLTPTGHQYLAEAIYDCFFASQETPIDGQAQDDPPNTTFCLN